jgi:tRNA (adenine57-N1/adenine58-N1)-methyltransferase
MYETLLRPHEVANIPQPRPIGEISEKLKEAEKKREEKRLRQIANNNAKRKRGDHRVGSGDEAIARQQDLGPGDASPDRKRARTDGGEGECEDAEAAAEADIIAVSVQTDMITADGEIVDRDGSGLVVVADESRRMEITNSPSHAPAVAPCSRISVSNAFPDVRGHTSYLTFAVLVPFSAPPVNPSTGAGEPGASVPPSEPAPEPGASSLFSPSDKSSTEAS